VHTAYEIAYCQRVFIMHNSGLTKSLTIRDGQDKKASLLMNNRLNMILVRFIPKSLVNYKHFQAIPKLKT